MELGRRDSASKSGGMSADTIAQLKITLDDVKPTVLRRIEVPFDRLAGFI